MNKLLPRLGIALGVVLGAGSAYGQDALAPRPVAVRRVVPEIDIVTHAPRHPAQNVRLSCGCNVPKPLFVVDGLVLATPALDSLFMSLDPCSILNLTVWKGNDALSRYGAAGSNGAIEAATSIPFVVQGKLLTEPAEKLAALGAIDPKHVQVVRQLTLEQTQHYQRRITLAALEILLME